MPELPEVETIRRGLAKRILHKPIKKVDIRKARVVRPQPSRFARALTRKSFTAIRRRGKLLIFAIAGGQQFMLAHLKMTGQLIYEKGPEIIAGGHGFPPVGALSKYTHVIFHFTDGSRLLFNDLRQFGYLKLVDGAGVAQAEAAFGLEPLGSGWRWQRLKHAMAGRQLTIKAALLNQRLVAGIGNIYADEILFAARLRPTRRLPSLRPAHWQTIARATRAILARALKHGGTTFNNYRDAAGGRGNFTRLLKVYGRGGATCLRCRHALRRIKTAGRGTVYCPRCQT